MKPLLVGESNPYSFRPEDALLPWPKGAAGDRLARILGLTNDQYLAAFDRTDLCGRKWTAELARKQASLILLAAPEVAVKLHIAKGLSLPDEAVTREELF